MNKFSIVDIETTGGSRNGNKITEIAIINMDGDEVVEEFSTLINPERSIPINITYLTGITNQMVETAPKFFEVAKKIVEMTEGRIFVAHNVFFDYNFIKHEFSELGFQFKREKLCTVRLARKYLPGHKSYSLGNICDDLYIKIDGRHRALGDAKATSILFNKILSNLDESDLVLSESKKFLLPPHLDREEYEKLPNTAGVYYFYNSEGVLLYVGKSKDIKKRVTQHFRPDIKRRKDIQLKNAVARIDYKELGNELAALLYECHEIKEKWPPFNTSMKSKKFTYGVKLILGKDGLLKPKVFSSVDESEFVYIFKNKSRAQRKIDKTYKSLLGDLSSLDNLDLKASQMAKMIGVEQYNKMIDRVFHMNMPKQDNFFIKLSGPKRSKCQIEVENKSPVKINFLNESELCEQIDLKQDPQMKDILWNYLAKYKIQTFDISPT